MATRLLAMIAGLTVLVATGCAESGISGLEAAVDFGACSTATENVEFVPAEALLSYTQSWLKIESSKDVDNVELQSADRNVTVEVEARDALGSGSVGIRHSASLELHSSYLPAMAWALSTGGEVFIARGQPEYSDQVLTLFVLIHSNDGTYFFPGDCQYAGLTAPLQRSLGTSFDSKMSQLIGLNESGAIASALVQGVPQVQGPKPVDRVSLNPEDVPASVFESLDQIEVALEIPTDWRGMPYTVCTKIDEGWNECLDLRLVTQPVTELGAYVGPSRKLEVWLLDGEGLYPVQIIGYVDLASLGDEILKAKHGAVVRVLLSGELATATDAVDPLDSPSTRVIDADTWEDLLADPERYEEVLGDASSTSGPKNGEQAIGNDV